VNVPVSSCKKRLFSVKLSADGFLSEGKENCFMDDVSDANMSTNGIRDILWPVLIFKSYKEMELKFDVVLP